MFKQVKLLLGLETSPKPYMKKRANSLRGNFITMYTHAIENDFEIESTKPLGSGGFGVVVMGVNKASSRSFAIKFINKFSHLTRIEREIKLLSDIDHANIVRLFSVYDSDSQVAFVFDLCTGGHLGELTKRSPLKYLTEDTAKPLIRQLISAVMHMHSRGICHRDIKLQNILLENMDSQHAQIKLIDFGFATRFVGVTPLKTRCGTAYAMAPEVFKESYDERCDIWSVGVVLYFLLCGHRPFSPVELPGDLKDAGRAAMVTNILMGRYHFNFPPFKNVSAEGISFIQKTFVVNYRNRFSAKDAWSHGWLNQSGIKTKFDISTLKDKDTPLSAAVSNLRMKGKSTTLGNTGMVAVAFNHDRNDAPELRSLFQTFDTDNVGFLSKDAFRKAMKSVSPDLTVEEIDQLFAAIDVDDDKQISFTEFLAATMDPREVDMEELSKAFRLLDSDNKGYLTVDDFYRVLANSPGTSVQLSSKAQTIKVNDSIIDLPASKRGAGGSSEEISKSGFGFYDESDPEGNERERAILLKKIAQMIKTADSNNDGVLSYQEFLLGIIALGADSELGDAVEVLNEQRDVFDHASLAKGSEKLRLKSILSTPEAPIRTIRGSKSDTGDVLPAVGPPAGRSGSLPKVLLSPRVEKVYSNDSSADGPGDKLTVCTSAEETESKLTPKIRDEVSSEVPLDQAVKLPTMSASPRKDSQGHFEHSAAGSKSPKLLPIDSTPVTPQQTERNSDRFSMTPEASSIDKTVCSPIMVGSLGCMLRLSDSNTTLTSTSPASSPMRIRGPPAWIANKSVLSSLSHDIAKAAKQESSSPITAKSKLTLPPI